MVRPAHFAYNEETAADNAFMQPARILSQTQIEARARGEFDGLVAALRAVGTRVTVVADTPLPRKPDAVFPNNWFSTHADGTIVLYPMTAPTRRLERLNPVLETLAPGFAERRVIDLTPYEERGQYLEGTGALVLDRLAKIAYVCRSERSDDGLARRWAALIDYELVIFDATDESGLPIYHTNVLMAIGTKHAVLCTESVAPGDRARLVTLLRGRDRMLIELSYAQMRRFAGNMLELLNGSRQAYWAMSSQAFGALTDAQRAVLGEGHPIVHADLEAIEQLGGGSARCMIAEIYLPASTTAR